MSDPTDQRAAGARTLPEWLRLQARQRGTATALRHKRLGLWRSKSWRELEAWVSALARGLAERGFVTGDRLLLDAPAGPEAIALSLAAWWLGGAIVVLEPAEASGGEEAADVSALARFVLVADEAGRARYAERRAPSLLGIVLDADVLDADDALLRSEPTWVSLESLAAARSSAEHPSQHATPAPPVAEGSRVALIRRRAERSRVLGADAPDAERTYRHEALIARAEALARRGGWGSKGAALASRELATGDRLEIVLPAWLSAGFCWSFVEHATTEDVDRRELAPELVFGSTRDFADLAQRVAASLPPRERGVGRWLHAGLEQRGVAGGWARRLLTARLREVTGLGRAQRVVAVGSAGAAAPAFEHLFGLSLFPGSEPALHAAETETPASAAAAAQSSRRLVAFDAAELSAQPRSGVG